MRHTILAAALAFFAITPAVADTALIAVATNFADAAGELAAAYSTASGNRITLTSGATGKIFAQITAGAPFDAFLSADAAAPEKLEAAGLGVPGSRAPYALGQLVLWTADPARDMPDLTGALKAARHIAIANPDLAPYGRAAAETLEALGLTAEVADRIVTGENIGQAFTLTGTGAADMGFVAASALIAAPGGRSLPVPADLHGPIRQDAVLLRHGEGNAAAQGFLDYIHGDAGRAIIARFGYGLPD
jgi:molybdate transport system substrate-binding protein